eukprot:SAG31_NODE_110_length_24476_cov_9.909654_6_plen_81_part_00
MITSVKPDLVAICTAGSTILFSCCVQRWFDCIAFLCPALTVSPFAPQHVSRSRPRFGLPMPVGQTHTPTYAVRSQLWVFH